MNRKEKREFDRKLQGPSSMYQQLDEAFKEAIIKSDEPYDVILGHFSMLWQEYCSKKNKSRDENDKIDPYFFLRTHEKEKEINSNPTLLGRIRKITGNG